MSRIYLPKSTASVENMRRPGETTPAQKVPQREAGKAERKKDSGILNEFAGEGCAENAIICC